MPSQPEYLEKVRTQAEWHELFAHELISMGVNPAKAEACASTHVSRNAVSNLNAMANVQGSQVLYELFVKELFKKVP